MCSRSRWTQIRTISRKLLSRSSVRTVNCLGKSKRQHTRKGLIAGKKSDWKKAIVTLGNGQVIDYYAGAGDKSDKKD